MIPCGMKFLRKFIFADWRLFVFLWELIFRLGQIGFSSWELIFAYPVPSIDNIFIFIEYVQ